MIGMVFLWSHLTLDLTLPTSAFPSVHIVGSLTSRFPSIGTTAKIAAIQKLKKIELFPCARHQNDEITQSLKLWWRQNWTFSRRTASRYDFYELIRLNASACTGRTMEAKIGTPSHCTSKVQCPKLRMRKKIVVNQDAFTLINYKDSKDSMNQHQYKVQSIGYGSIPIFLPFLVGYSHP